MNGDRDPILDSFLEEVLGNKTPPNLTDRILRAMEERRIAGGSSPPVLTPNLSAHQTSYADSIVPPPVERAVRPQPSVSTDTSRSTRTWFIAAGGTLALSVAAVLIVMALQNNSQRPNRSVADKPSETENVAKPGSLTKEGNEQEAPAAANRQPTPSVASREPATEEKKTKPEVKPPEKAIASSQPKSTSQPTVELRSTPPEVKNSVVESTTRSLEPKEGKLVVQRLDELVRVNWVAHQVEPASKISDDEWCQRTFRMVLGRDATPEELRQFQSAGKDRKRLLVELLVNSDQYTEEFSKRWSTLWADILLDSDIAESVPPSSREGLTQYLRRAFQERKSFDRIVVDLITATGSGVPGTDGYNGAANFLITHADDKFVRTTADTARLLLGRNIDCQQCHDDPHFDGGQQEQFWELNAFFRQLVLRRDAANNLLVLENVDFRGEGPDSQKAGLFFTQPNGLIKVAYPEFFDRSAVPPQGQLSVVDRRRELAQLVVASEDFRCNVANRVWAVMFGRGWTEAAQIVRNNRPEYPPALVELADQFAAHDFDFRKLVSWVALSEPFQLSAGTSVILAADSQRLFNQFQSPAQSDAEHRRVQEVLLATAKEFAQPSSTAATTAKIDSSVKSLTKDGKAISEPIDPQLRVAVPTVVISPMFKAVMNSKLTDKQKAEHLFQMLLHRQPRARELVVVEEMLKQSSDNPEKAWTALWGALDSTAR